MIKVTEKRAGVNCTPYVGEIGGVLCCIRIVILGEAVFLGVSELLYWVKNSFNSQVCCNYTQVCWMENHKLSTTGFLCV